MSRTLSRAPTTYRWLTVWSLSLMSSSCSMWLSPETSVETVEETVSVGEATVIEAGAAELTFPEDAVSEDTEVRVEQGDPEEFAPPPEDATPVSPLLVLTPHGTTFDAPVEVRLAFDGDNAGDADDLVVIRIANENAVDWEPVDGATFDNDVAVFEILGFSGYRVITCARSGNPVAQQRCRRRAWTDPEPAEPDPTPEPAEPDPTPEPAEPDPTPDPVVDAGAPEPDPVVDAGAPEPDPVADAGAPEPDPVADAGAPEPDPVVDAGAPEPDPVVDAGAPEPDPVVDAGDPEPDPVVDAGAPEPDPVVDAGAPEPDPVVDAGAPEPDPVVDAGAPEPDPDDAGVVDAGACEPQVTRLEDEEPVYTKVTGSSFSGTLCALRSDGAIDCWGGARDDVTRPPPGRFVDVDLTGSNGTPPPGSGTPATACALRESDLRAECWGVSLGDAPDEALIDIEVAGMFNPFACGVRASDSTGVCWDEAGTAPEPPAGVGLTDIVGGYKMACGIRVDDGTLECFGDLGDVVVPPDSFAGFSLRVHEVSDTFCGYSLTAGDFVCFSRESTPFAAPLPPAGVVLLDFAFGGDHACGITSDIAGGTPEVTCWGDTDAGWWDSNGLFVGNRATQPPPGLELGSITASFDSTCGIRYDGQITCFGGKGMGEGRPDSAARYAAIEKSDRVSCALSDAGAIHCFTDNVASNRVYSTVSEPPAGVVFASFDLSALYGCGIEQDTGAAVCWGTDLFDSGVLDAPVSVSFSQLEVNASQACGLVEGTQEIVCWGRTGQETYLLPDGSIGVDDFDPPSGTFALLDGEYDRMCALDASGMAHCWGSTRDAPTVNDPPPVAMHALASGVDFLCGLRDDDDTAECWGRTVALGAQVPAGVAFERIAVAESFGCGIRIADGEVECWGSAFGTDEPVPPGPFVDIDVGGYDACALRADGVEVCWGSLARNLLEVAPAVAAPWATVSPLGVELSWEAVAGADSYVLLRVGAAGETVVLTSGPDLWFIDEDPIGFQAHYQVQACEGATCTTSPLTVVQGCP